MRAIVTGGAGLIGSRLTRALARGGDDVLVVDDLSAGAVDAIVDVLGERVRLLRMSILDAGLTAAVADFEPDVVFHLAAQTSVPASMTDPVLDATVNVAGSVAVLHAAHVGGARRVVNSSSGGALFGTECPFPTPESQRPHPVSAYGMSKLAVEEYARWFGRTHGCDIVTLRYGNVYGPSTSAAGVVTRLCLAALLGKRPDVYGDGRQTRDFVHVDDVVAANLTVAGHRSLRHDVYHVGTGIETSIVELIAVLAEAAGLDPVRFTPVHRPARPGDLPRSWPDVTRWRTEFGGCRTPLYEGLVEVLSELRMDAGARPGEELGVAG